MKREIRPTSLLPLLILFGLLSYVSLVHADAEALLSEAGPVGELKPSTILEQSFLSELESAGHPVTEDLLTSTTVRVRERKFTPEELQAAYAQYLKLMPANDARTTKNRLDFRIDLATTYLIAERAREDGATLDAEFQRQKDLLLTRLAAQYYIRSRLLRDISISDAEITQYYQEHASQFARPELVELQLVLTSTPEKAREALAELATGAAFSTVAEKYSIHASRLRGGKLSPIPRGTLDGEIEAAAFQLRDGERSEIIETKSGFYIVERVSTREPTVVPLERARPEIYQILYERRRLEILESFYEEVLRDSSIELLAPIDSPAGEADSATTVAPAADRKMPGR